MADLIVVDSGTTKQPQSQRDIFNISRITPFAFRSRFTTQEKVAIEIASLDDPSKSMEIRSQAATLRALQKDSELASFIDLQNQSTRDGVTALETIGLLSEGRALEILDAPVQESEKAQ